MASSRIPGFYKMSVEERRKAVMEFAGLSSEEISLFEPTGSLPIDLADRMIENVIGVMEVPFGVATNFLINGRDYLIPMAIEEPSVVAAASHAAKLARVRGGFHTSSTDPLMIAQVQLTGVPDPYHAKAVILEHRQEIMDLANEQDKVLIKVGGGCRDVQVRVIDTSKGPMVVTHLIVDVRDAMGANAVNTMAEAVAPLIERITGGKVYLRILSNLAVLRLARARAVWDRDAIGGEEVVEGILWAYHFARADPFRAATHNKGIMNGIDAVLIATANDWRAVEAGAHAYAALNGYTSLTHYERDAEGNLVGTIEIPLAVGIVGGATVTHPKARVARKILGVKTAREFAEVLAAVGLAQNFAALRALATEGIQRGHMSLHARNIAVMAGATGDLIDAVADRMVAEGRVNVERAKEILKELTEKGARE